MLALIGRILILLALGAATAGAVVGFSAGRTRSAYGQKWAERLAWLFCAAMLLANGVMIFALITHDFSVSYVAQVGSRATPLHITIVSLWSSLEGSILFWGAVIALYTAWFVRFTPNQHRALVPYTLGTLMSVAAFFSVLISGPANPFLDTPLPIPLDGPGPNPLLQNHILMIIHPPMLYLGYVGMTVPFAMGVTTLLRGELSRSWMAATRRWMLLPWGFLTAGIFLGGWWAYEVLGWGGYWAWDPVENASLLPWLTATAFIHAAMLEERRGILKGWTMVLLLVTFALTILGTFMTRSGVFNSVHSFTQSDIGPTLLGFLAVVVVGSIVLLALRIHHLDSNERIHSPVSREAAFVANNFLFVSLTFTVLVGTTFPLITEAVRGVKISVGEPFFNQFAVPMGLAIVFLMGVGPALPWGKVTFGTALRAMSLPATVALLTAALGVACGARELWPLLALAASGFAAAVTIKDMVIPIVKRIRRNAESPAIAAKVAISRGRRRYGGQIVHLGIALAAVAIALSGAYKTSREGVIDRGQTMDVGAYVLRFESAETYNEPHRQRTVARISVTKNGRAVGVFEPAMNHYRSQMNPIGTPDVHTSLVEDLYLSVMQIDPDGRFVGLRVYVNPAVFWLWFSLGMIIVGCLIAAWPIRQREAEGASKAAGRTP